MSIFTISSFIAGIGSVVIGGMIVVAGIAVIAGAGVALCSGIGAMVSAGCR